MWPSWAGIGIFLALNLSSQIYLVHTYDYDIHILADTFSLQFGDLEMIVPSAEEDLRNFTQTDVFFDDLKDRVEHLKRVLFD